MSQTKEDVIRERADDARRHLDEIVRTLAPNDVAHTGTTLADVAQGEAYGDANALFDRLRDQAARLADTATEARRFLERHAPEP